MDDGDDGPRAPVGRLHGRLLAILALVSVAAAVAAVWLFSPMMFQSEEEPSAVWPWEDSATVGFPIESASSEAAAESSEASASTAAPSPSASGASPSTEAPSDSDEPDDGGGGGGGGAEAEPEPEPEPEGAECTASLRLGNQWRDSGEVHFEAWVEVANTGGSPIDDWEIELAIDGTEVYRSWGMEHEGGDRYEAERWNSDIERGASAEAGFQGSVDDDVELPDTVPCSAFA